MPSLTIYNRELFAKAQATAKAHGMTVSWLGNLALKYALDQLKRGQIQIVHCGDLDCDSNMEGRAE